MRNHFLITLLGAIAGGTVYSPVCIHDIKHAMNHAVFKV